MKELRAITTLLSLFTLSFLIYGACAPGRAAGNRPTMRITEPIHGAVVQGVVTVAVSYRSTSGANITHVEMWVDKTQYKQVKLERPAPEGTYSFVWDTAGLAAGLHTITAIAYDAKGNPGDAAVSVYFDNSQSSTDVQAPRVAVRAPASGSTVSGIVRVLASVVDNVGVKMVSFYLNDRFRSATNHPPFTLDWDTTKVPNGPYSIKVSAFDAAENVGESSPILVNVNNPTGRTLPNETLSKAPQPQPERPQVASPSEPTRVQPDEKRMAVGPKPGPALRPTGSTIPVPPVLSSTPAPLSHPDLDVDFLPAGSAEVAAAPSMSAMPPTTRQARPSISKPVVQPVWVATSPTKSRSSRPVALETVNAGQRLAQPAGRALPPVLSAPAPLAEALPGTRVTESQPASFQPAATATATPRMARNVTPLPRPSVAPAARRSAPTVGARGGAAQVSPSGMRVARTDVSLPYAGAGASMSAPSAQGAPVVGTRRTAPEATAVNSEASAALAPGAAQSRMPMPSTAGAPALGVSASRPVIVPMGAASRRSRLVASAERRRLTEPSAFSGSLGSSAGGPAPVSPAPRASSVGAPAVARPMYDPQVVLLVTDTAAGLTPLAAEPRLDAPRTMGAPRLAAPANAPQVVAFSSPRGDAAYTTDAATMRATEPNGTGAPFLSTVLRAPQVAALFAPGAASLNPFGSDARIADPVTSVAPVGSSAGGLAPLPSPAPQVARAFTAPEARLAPAGAPAGSAAGAAGGIAVMGRQTRQALPHAVVSTPRDTMPPARRPELPAGTRKPAPVENLVINRNGKKISVVYNGRPVDFGRLTPFSRDGMTLAPFRNIFEHSGGVVFWNNLIKRVKASSDGRKVEFTIGDLQALVNDKSVRMQTAPVLVDGRAVVPLSFLRDALDVTIEYNPATGRIVIAAK